jgi:aminopeptidase N
MHFPRFAAFFLSGSALLLFPAPMHAEKPYDFTGTPGKLPKQILPTDYAIRIVPHLDKFSFTGSETIKLTVRTPVRQIVLNALELEITSAALDNQPLPKSALKLDRKQELLTLSLPNELPPGDHTLSLAFTGKIYQQGQGLFYAQYQEQGTGAKKTMLGTQFEATDARRFFPCWDEPSFRARFQLTAVVPSDWLAVSNMPVESETRVPDGKEVRFASTPPMASYLNVFVAGELDLVETESHGVQVRVITTKGKAEWGRYALESSVKILDYYNDYFGVSYPLPKLDQIAIPGGFGGAMENWGGITYFESSLLFDPKTTSDDAKQEIFAVLAHEMAHQWFGDLVTMAWWDNLWLNEGFASWMGTKCTAHFNPQWEVWLRKNVPRNPMRRVGIAKEQAMEGDVRSTTHPIQQPVATEAEANSAFDDITYKKGQSFLRMLESFLGADPFRDGIRHYISLHKYSNSTTADLWRALADASGKPVTEIAAAWTEQPGFPVVTVKREEDKILLTQERLTVNFKNPPPARWQIPLTWSVVGQDKTESRLMTAASDALAGIPAGTALKLNLDGAGNYRVQYDDKSWDLLLDSLSNISVDDRVNLLSDEWALVQANRVPLSRYLRLVEAMPSATELAERDQIINAFDFTDHLLVGQPDREKFQRYARSVLRPSFDALGWEPKSDEPIKQSNLRASLIAALGDLNDPGVIGGCRDRFQKYLEDPTSLPADLRRSILVVVGRYADEATWKKLHDLGLTTTNIGEKQDDYDALASVTDPALIPKTLQIALTSELPTSRAIFLVGKVARYSDHPDLAWQFARANMKALLAKADALSAYSYAPGLFTFFSDSNRIEELKSYAKSNLPPESAKDVAKAIDEIQIRAELKPRLAREFTNWSETRKKP